VVHPYDIENINQLGAGQLYLGDPLSFPASTGFPAGPAPCLTRPNQQYANINMRGSLGTGSYNALNVKLQTHDVRRSGFSLIAKTARSFDRMGKSFRAKHFLMVLTGEL
jgi:hypothetical protein